MTVPDKTGRPTSVQNALRLLNVFSVEEAELGITELAEKMGIANSTAHRLVTTLRNEGFIAKDPYTNKYRLGIRLLALSNVVTSSMDIYQVSAPILEELKNTTNESVNLALFRDDEVIFLNRVDSVRSMRSLSNIGSRAPAHCTSSGQVFLAYQPKEATLRIMNKGLKLYTPKTITEPGQLQTVLQIVRNQGFAVSIEELHAGVASVAAPIWNSSGQVSATVSIAGSVQRFNKDTLPNLTKLAIQSAEMISAKLNKVRKAERG